MQFSTVTKKLPGVSSFNRLSKQHKITAAGTTAAAAVLLAVVGVEATAGAGAATAASDATTGFSVSAGQPVKQISALSSLAPQKAVPAAAQQKVNLVPVADKSATDTAQKAAAAKAAAVKKAAAEKATAQKAAAKKAAAKKAAAKKAAAAKAKPAAKTYANNLDGWIRQSLDIMHKKGIPGTYEGIHRNVIRESSGNPKAINLWDINARNGIPSKGLLQVINPTFNAYHVSGTSWNIYNPVANITAACNYAADKYGSMDNVNSAY
ncbi:transglycosylase SLT domain-containing protein [Streptomyces sp. NBC_00448]|uniref:transglycosylase SLT domain-containing protein n=1 Tax=Streptomyces sp. NBC_00448 TaxID=2903652 RepID=UPI002E1E8E88